ncbi:hypothetical protein WKK05_39885 (plasmid) [Nostoc sp. UHCC 0302]|uniref:hypothetical protein n=1 Tax=Nostoc sp. UHCC 0302 TaxID=3134896 RepID=UPI00311CBF3F
MSQQNPKISLLKEFVSDELLTVAQQQIPQGKSQEYYRGLHDAFSQCAKILASLNSKDQALMIAALLIELEKKITLD